MKTTLLLAGCALALGTGWAADAPDTAKIYASKCAMCHAKDGKGNPAMAKMYKIDPKLMSLVGEDTAKHTDAELIKITTDGLEKMPAYKGKLTETEIKDLVAYIRTLAKK